MNKVIKKLLVGVMASTMLLGSLTTAFAATGSATTSVVPEAKEEVVAEKTETGITPTVDTTEKGNAFITEIAATTKTTVKVSSTVEVNGVEYKVRKIAEGAFANCTNVKTIELPKTIKTIGKNAFTGASDTLKTIKITSTKAPEVAKSAFEGVDTTKKTITVSKKMSTKEYKKLKKALKAAGFKGKIKRA